MSYDSVSGLADKVETTRLDFRDCLLSLDILIESLDGAWEGKAKQEFDSAYKKARKKLAASSDAMKDFAEEVRKTAARQSETDHGTASSFSGALPFGPVAGKPALHASSAPVGASLYGNACPVQKASLYSRLKADYDAKGDTYKWFQYGSSAVRVVAGFATMVEGAVEVVTVAGAPVGVVHLMSGANEFGNAIVDGILVHDGLYDQVGQNNMLKEKLADSGKKMGAYFGNEEMGEAIGNASYYGLDVVNFLSDGQELLESFGNLNTAVTGTEKTSFVWGESKWEELVASEQKITVQPDVLVRRWMGIKPTEKGSIIFDAAKNTVSSYLSGNDMMQGIESFRDELSTQ